jgi:HSP20 family protein
LTRIKVVRPEADILSFYRSLALPRKEKQEMAEAASKLPASPEKKEVPTPTPSRDWQPLERLRDEVDRIFDEFRRGTWPNPFRRSSFDDEPFWRHGLSWAATPAVDIVEKDNAYEITAELPGIDEKNIEVQFSDGTLAIKGEKTDEKEEKKKDYYLSERRYGSFHRSFRVPDGVDADRIEAQFKNGVLTVTMPKSADAKKKERKIAVTAK